MTLRGLGQAAAAAIVLFAGMGAAHGQEAGGRNAEAHTATPIKHVIIVIGENRTFDHVFGLHKPKPGETVSNLLSKGIVTEDGKPGPNFALARQFTVPGQTSYFIAADDKKPYDLLPAPQLAGTPNAQSEKLPPFLPALLGKLAQFEPNLSAGDLTLLTTGASGLASVEGVDTRVQNATSLPNGPFQLTGPHMPYDAYTGDPVHRFYQMWQQSDCSVKQATAANPSGCLSDLYPYVANSYSSSVQGGMAMAFLNVLKGDAPYLKALADEYTMSDNYHQAQMGGTMVEHFYIAMADNVYFSDGKGNAIPAPADAIANPNPAPGSTRYTLDARYSNCSDMSQPGVAPIVTYLASLPYKPDRKCAPGHYYVLNNQSPGYKTDGSLDPVGVPPTAVRSIGDALNEKGISFRYYGAGVPARAERKPGGCAPLLRYLQPVPVSNLDHGRSGTARGAFKGYHRPLRGYRGRHASGGVLRQARRADRRASAKFEAQPVRIFRAQHRRTREGQAGAVRKHRNLRHLRRRRRILRLRASSSRSTSSATARASPSSLSRLTAQAAISATITQTTPRW